MLLLNVFLLLVVAGLRPAAPERSYHQVSVLEGRSVALNRGRQDQPGGHVEWRVNGTPFQTWTSTVEKRHDTGFLRVGRPDLANETETSRPNKGTAGGVWMVLRSVRDVTVGVYEAIMRIEYNVTLQHNTNFTRVFNVTYRRNMVNVTTTAPDPWEAQGKCVVLCQSSPNPVLNLSLEGLPVTGTLVGEAGKFLRVAQVPCDTTGVSCLARVPLVQNQRVPVVFASLTKLPRRKKGSAHQSVNSRSPRAVPQESTVAATTVVRTETDCTGWFLVIVVQLLAHGLVLATGFAIRRFGRPPWLPESRSGKPLLSPSTAQKAESRTGRGQRAEVRLGNGPVYTPIDVHHHPQPPVAGGAGGGGAAAVAGGRR